MNNKNRNNVRKLREQLLMSKAELAKAAGLSVLTVDRVERGEECRVATKRKIIKALGLNLGDKNRVFGH
ncbi:MAG: helix-turn-helix transcriptional regulator [Pseudomonadota bacterium]